MATFSRDSLSGSANFNLIRVDAASSPGILIHTATSLTAEDGADEVWLWAVNSHTATLKLTVEWGAAVASIIHSLPSKDGFSLVIPGISLRGSNVVRAYGENASQLFVGGHVNYIRP